MFLAFIELGDWAAELPDFAYFAIIIAIIALVLYMGKELS